MLIRIAISPAAYPCSFAQAALSAAPARSRAEMLSEGLAMTTSEFAATFGDMAGAYDRTHETTWRNAKHRQALTDYCGPIRLKPVASRARRSVRYRSWGLPGGVEGI